jgi:hypothetical protein
MQTLAQGGTFTNITGSGAGSRRALWTGRILSTLAVLFLGLDSFGKLAELEPVMTESTRLGYSPNVVFTLGVILLLCVVVYVIPRTSVLGAVLLTGYLGGAVATHVRMESPLFTHILFPMYVALFVWGGLVLRDRRLHAFFPWRAQERG